MGCAITLVARNESQAAILELWDRAAAFEAAPSMRTQNYPPHITLAVLPEVNAGAVWPKVKAVPAGAASLQLSFGAIRAFTVPSLVLWAAPEHSACLTDWHSRLHERLDPAACHDHYRPENWVPHCTLATEIKNELKESALGLVSERIEPFQVVFDRFECVSLAPVKLYQSVKLQRPRA